MPTFDYEAWKSEVQRDFDIWVANNFVRLYSATGSEYQQLWGEATGMLYQRYELANVRNADPDIELKKKMQHYIFITQRIYAEKEFPWELCDKKTYSFVTQYGVLPKQSPEEWNNFNLEDCIKERNEMIQSKLRLKEARERFKKDHPEYINS